MEESKRLITSWVRIKHWLSENFPETLENLYSPAFDSQIASAEATIGLPFPGALKTLLLEHNGEDHHWPPGIFPGGHRFLPTEDIVETWYKLKEFNDATPEHWLPFSQSRAKSIRFLDFDPPQGGTAGQVVEVDFNLQTYDVLADSLVDYIEKYAIDLAVNKYAVIGDDILLNDESLNMDHFPEEDSLGHNVMESVMESVVESEPTYNENAEFDAVNEDMLDFELLDELPHDEALEQEMRNIDAAQSVVVESAAVESVAVESAAVESVAVESAAIESVATQNAADTAESDFVNDFVNDVISVTSEQASDIDLSNIPVLDDELRIDLEDYEQTSAHTANQHRIEKNTVRKNTARENTPHNEEDEVSVASAVIDAPSEVRSKNQATNNVRKKLPGNATRNASNDAPKTTAAARKAVNQPQKPSQHTKQSNTPVRTQRQPQKRAAARNQTPAKPRTEPAVKPAAKAAAQSTTNPAAKPAARKAASNAQPVAQQTRNAVANKPAKPAAAPHKPATDRLESAERLIIVGEMTTLMGKEEMLFTVETEQAKEYTFLAKASFTKGFADIALDQYVRILAKKFHGEIKSHFIDQGLAQQPEYVAFEYVVLPIEKPSTPMASLPPPENLDEIAHQILQTIQTSVKRGCHYQEVKTEQSPYLRSRFYNDNTEKLLKLGFHYTADLLDQAVVRSTQHNPPFFRVMSFFDDGIVASFYHTKPKFSWPFHASRKVIEFETELSDGNIIISTTAEDEIEYPLPTMISRYVHPAGIPIEGLLHKHRAKIRRYQTHKPDASIVKVRSKKDFVALRQRRQQMIYNHLKSIGWVTKEYVAKQFNNKEVAEQVYARIKQFAGTKV
jgi:cell wall assembly regulator SMI1